MVELSVAEFSPRIVLKVAPPTVVGSVGWFKSNEGDQKEKLLKVRGYEITR